MSNSRVRIKKASNMSQGENYYMQDQYFYASSGQRKRVMSYFRSSSADTRCSARAMSAYDDAMYPGLAFCGSFQALIEPQA